MTTLEEVIGKMIAHSVDNPAHGFNCACKDTQIRAARRIIGAIEPGAWDEALYLFAVLARTYRRAGVARDD